MSAGWRVAFERVGLVCVGDGRDRRPRGRRRESHIVPAMGRVRSRSRAGRRVWEYCIVVDHVCCWVGWEELSRRRGGRAKAGEVKRQSPREGPEHRHGRVKGCKRRKGSG